MLRFSLNKHEGLFLRDQLKREGFQHKKNHYHKIWDVEEGNRFLKKFHEHSNKDIISLVVNFVDLLAHNSSQTNVLKEIIGNALICLFRCLFGHSKLVGHDHLGPTVKIWK